MNPDHSTMTSTGIRVLFVAPAARAGTAQYTHSLAVALARRGHRVALATGIAYELALQAREYELIEVFDRYRPRPIRLARFCAFALRFRPDIVHLQGAQHPAVYLVVWALLRVLTDARFVYTPQDVLPNVPRDHDLKAFRMLYARMSHVFLNARQNLDQVTETFRVPEERITVLPMPDLLAFLREGLTPSPPEVAARDRVLLCFGLIEPRKGIATLLNAFPAVRRSVPDALLLIVGKPLMPLGDLRDRIASAAVGDRCKLVPEYVSFEAMAGYFERAEVVVLPYESGWNSGVVSAAFGYGKIVVATQVGGFEEVIEDGQTGLLVPPRDPEALARAIIRVLNDMELRERLARQVPEAGRRYSWAAVAAETEGRYAAILDRAGKREAHAL